jgi:hypothetical protein
MLFRFSPSLAENSFEPIGNERALLVVPIVFGRRHVSAAYYLTRIVMIAAGKLLFQS